jgi:hypothetical protein
VGDGNRPVPLRRAAAAWLSDDRGGGRWPVNVDALGEDALSFLSGRFVPPGTARTLLLRRRPPAMLRITVVAVSAGERESFRCLARVTPGDRRRLAGLLPAAAAERVS